MFPRTIRSGQCDKNGEVNTIKIINGVIFVACRTYDIFANYLNTNLYQLYQLFDKFEGAWQIDLSLIFFEEYVGFRSCFFLLNLACNFIPVQFLFLMRSKENAHTKDDSSCLSAFLHWNLNVWKLYNVNSTLTFLKNFTRMFPILVHIHYLHNVLFRLLPLQFINIGRYFSRKKTTKRNNLVLA